MPDLQPGQQWKHGWIPLTPAAVRKKNHGRTPGPDSKLGRLMDNAIRDRARQRSSPASRRDGGRDRQATGTPRASGRPYERVDVTKLRPGMPLYSHDPNDRYEVVRVRREGSGSQMRGGDYVLEYRNRDTGRISTIRVPIGGSVRVARQ